MATDGIAGFWAWWPTARERIQAAIEGGGFGEALVEEIAGRVSAISKEIDWELGPGGQARHAFCLSPKGDPKVRKITERWLRAAPAPDEIWEYHPARRGNAELAEARLEIDGIELAVGELVAAFQVDEGRELVNVTCFHPAFPRMSEDLRGTATFLMLDGALGEDGVERWLGAIETAAAAPDGARPIADLQAAIHALAKTATGERFAVMRGQDSDGRLLFVTLNTALKRIDHLACDSHVAIDLALLQADPNGLTTNEEAEQLNAIEDEIGPLLADAAYFGRVTGRGRRILHYFAPGDSPGRARLAEWVSRHRDRDPRVAWTEDPRWEARERFL
jgi:uncharacterized protein DUF695